MEILWGAWLKKCIFFMDTMILAAGHNGDSRNVSVIGAAAVIGVMLTGLLGIFIAVIFRCGKGMGRRKGKKRKRNYRGSYQESYRGNKYADNGRRSRNPEDSERIGYGDNPDDTEYPDYDKGLNAEEYLDYDQGPDAEECLDYDREPDAEECLDYGVEPDAEEYLEYDEEPDAEEYLEYDEEPDAEEYLEYDEEPNAEECLDYGGEPCTEECLGYDREPDTEECLGYGEEPNAEECLGYDRLADAEECLGYGEEPDAEECLDYDRPPDAEECLDYDRPPDAEECLGYGEEPDTSEHIIYEEVMNPGESTDYDVEAVSGADFEETEEIPVIRVDNVTMKYKVATSSTSGLKDFLIQKIKKQITTRDLLALDGVSFDVYKGEVVGIIGTNGSGKSTLLKIVSGALKPTGGKVIVDQSKIQLLTLGAGFDTELSARENVYLNGAIIGYSRDFIDAHYNEIVEFAELEGFMDEKVKNFSSGMVSRLGFAIATAGDAAEILILDEVLSVGDEFFRKKSLARVKEMIHGGSTVLMVSHGMGTILSNCTKAVWIEKGRLQMAGDTKTVCEAYRRQFG